MLSIFTVQVPHSELGIFKCVAPSRGNSLHCHCNKNLGRVCFQVQKNLLLIVTVTDSCTQSYTKILALFPQRGVTKLLLNITFSFSIPLPGLQGKKKSVVIFYSKLTGTVDNPNLLMIVSIVTEHLHICQQFSI